MNEYPNEHPELTTAQQRINRLILEATLSDIYGAGAIETAAAETVALHEFIDHDSLRPPAPPECAA